MKKVFSIFIMTLTCVLLIASCSVSISFPSRSREKLDSRYNIKMNDAGDVDVSSLDTTGGKTTLKKICAFENAVFVLFDTEIGSECLNFQVVVDDKKLTPSISDPGDVLGMNGERSTQVLGGFVGMDIKSAEKIELWNVKGTEILKYDITKLAKSSIAQTKIYCDIDKNFKSKYGDIYIESYSESDAMGILKGRSDTVSGNTEIIIQIVDENGKDVFERDAMSFNNFYVDDPGMIFYEKAKITGKKRELRIIDRESQAVLESIKIN